MKPGWIYVFKVKGGGAYEGVFVMQVRGVYVWRGLPFCCNGDCPRFVPAADLEWGESIIEMKHDTTEWQYNAALSAKTA